MIFHKLNVYYHNWNIHYHNFKFTIEGFKSEFKNNLIEIMIILEIIIITTKCYAKEASFFSYFQGAL